MGKGMKAKPKNKRKLMATKADVLRSQHEAEKKLEQLAKEYEAKARKHQEEETLNATKIMQAIFCMALHDRFGFGAIRLCRVQEEIENISNKLSSGELGIDAFYEKLERIGIIIED